MFGGMSNDDTRSAVACANRTSFSCCVSREIISLRQNLDPVLSWCQQCPVCVIMAQSIHSTTHHEIVFEKNALEEGVEREHWKDTATQLLAHAPYPFLG